MSLPNWHEQSARRVPAVIRKTILDEGWIDVAINVHEPGTPMEFLFDVYEEYIDITSENDDFACGMCRQKVLEEWKQMKPYLVKLNGST